MFLILHKKDRNGKKRWATLILDRGKRTQWGRTRNSHGSCEKKSPKHGTRSVRGKIIEWQQVRNWARKVVRRERGPTVIRVRVFGETGRGETSGQETRRALKNVLSAMLWGRSS